MSYSWKELALHLHIWSAFLNWIPSFPLAGHRCDCLYSLEASSIPVLQCLRRHLCLSHHPMLLSDVFSYDKNACALFILKSMPSFLLFFMPGTSSDPSFVYTDLIFQAQ